MAEHYDPVSRAAHWLTFALLTAQYAIGWSLPEIHSNTQPTGLIRAHLTLGASLLVIVLLRLAWRLAHPGPCTLATHAEVASARSKTDSLGPLPVAVVPVCGWLGGCVGAAVAGEGLRVGSITPADGRTTAVRRSCGRLACSHR